MSPSSPSVVVLSDDMTGAVAAAGEARRAGSTAEVTSWDAVPEVTGAQVLVVDTNSRLLPPDEARRRVRDQIQQARERFGDAVMYKRIDTLLRGNTADEVRAWREAIAVPAVLVPAAPACGITTRGGHQLHRGAPIEVSPAAQDAPRTQLQGLLAAMPLGIGDIKATTFRLRLQEALRQGKDVLLDASDEADITQIARGAAREHARGTQFGLLGSYGFLGAWIEARLAPAPPRAGGALVVASSYQPSTLRQVEALASRPTAVVVDGTSGEPKDLRRAIDGLRDGRDVAIVTAGRGTPAKPSAAAAHTAATMAGQVLRQATPIGLVLLGGEVSSALLRLLAPRRLAVACEPWPATPVMRLEGGAHDGLLAVIQSGSQGEPTRTLHAIDLLAALGTERPHTRGANEARPPESRGAHA
ncbi:hypothetical protein GCM10027449_20230 [Sinomonas notoginsengisoli]|uniref:four-carbon acid sugar kinase family protein n=1 Tax=Sinomonas notoginsengisoli TaxID=1457311 RepID=UPI001F37BA5F|nr:four-carbon acid sugar kinase family protein [Sinomonas notoginsengisoli]